MSPKKRHVSWTAFNELTRMLVDVVPEDIRKLPMLTIGRGGVILAGILQYKFDNRRNQIITLESYTTDDKQDTQIKVHPGSLLALSEEMLLIDDLVDTGDTVAYLIDRYPSINFHLLTLFKKEKARDLPIPHYFAAPAPADIWLVLPWD